MNIKIAWKNLFRNPMRTLVTVIIIAVAVGGTIFYQGLIDGYDDMMMKNFLMGGPGHIQIFKDNFWVKKSPKLYFDPKKLDFYHPSILAQGNRITGMGLINTGEKTAGIVYTGVEIDKEPYLSYFKKWVHNGRWLKSSGEILLGEKLAKKLGLSVGDEVFLQAPMVDGNVGAITLTLVGIVKAPVEDVNSRMAILTISDARKLTHTPPGMVTQVVITIKDPLKVDNVVKAIKQHLNSSFKVYSWKKMIPIMDQWLKLMDETMEIFYMIIFVGAFFAILNTLLMAVFERRKEFGILLAIGMKPLRIIKMILWESFFLGVLGVIGGILIGVILVYYFSIHGVDLSFFSQALALLGLERYLYPAFTWKGIVFSAVNVFFTVFISALYPAYRTVKLKPTEALKD